MRLAILLLGLGLLSCSHGARDSDTIVREVLAAEQARLAAFRNDDKATYRRLVADDLTMVHSDGSVATRDDEMAVMRPSTPDRPLPTLHLEETRVRGFGHAAVVTGSLVERRGDRLLLRLRFTNVYARRGNEWVLVAGQLTRAPTG